MRKLIITLSLVFAISVAYSQIGADAVPKNTFEFEPFVGFSSSSSYFDDNGNTQDLFGSDTTMYFSSAEFSFIYGVFKDFEIGLATPLDVSTISFGAKYKLPIKTKMATSLTASYNIVPGNGIFIKRDSVHEETPSVGFGLVTTYEFSDKFLWDFDAQYHKHLSVTSEGLMQGISANTFLSYYFIENVKFIAGASYSFEDYGVSENNASLYTLNLGMEIERAENFVLVLHAPIDLFGKNQYKQSGFGLALTILLD